MVASRRPWDGGTSWSDPREDFTETTTEDTTILGGAADTWGHTWTPAELGDTSFRVRVVAKCAGPPPCDTKDYFLDWVAVQMTFTP